jgi:hypothetical protein
VTSILPGPWIDPDSRDDEPWSHAGGIVKFLEFPVRISAMSRRAFHLYWQRHHSPHVMNATPFSQFMRKYMTAHVCTDRVEGLPGHLLPAPLFEGAAEVWINGVDEAGNWLGHPLYAELIQPDEPRFIYNGGGVEVLMVKEQRLYDPDRDLAENNLTKLYMLGGRHARLERDPFHRAVAELGRKIVAQPALRGLLRRLVVSHRLCDPYPDWLPPTRIDAVLELWFEGLDDLRRFFAEPAYRSAIHPLEDAAFDGSSLRAFAARLHVVHDEFSFQPTTMQPLPFNWPD